MDTLTKKIIYAAYLIGFAALFDYLGHESYAEKVVRDQIYEENVCLWMRQASKSVPESDRDGHPNYKQRKVNCNVYDKVYKTNTRGFERASSRNTTTLHKGGTDS